jgi:hypothetical protein
LLDEKNIKRVYMPKNLKLVKKSWVKLNGILECWKNGMMGS